MSQQPEFDSDTLRVYEYVRDYLRLNRLSPTLREIADHCYLAHSTASFKLSKLEAKGWIMRELNMPRSIRLGEQAPDYLPDPD